MFWCRSQLRQSLTQLPLSWLRRPLKLRSNCLIHLATLCCCSSNKQDPSALVLLQQHQQTKQAVSAESTAQKRPAQGYSEVMADFKLMAEARLRESFPKERKNNIDKVIKAAWLGSEERQQCMLAMSDQEKRKRRFLPPLKASSSKAA